MADFKMSDQDLADMEEMEAAASEEPESQTATAAMVAAQEEDEADKKAKKDLRRIPALDTALDVGRLAFQGGSWNLAQESAGVRGGAAGVLGMVGNMFGMNTGLPGSPQEGYDEAYDEAQLNLDISKDRLKETSGKFAPMISEMLGAITGGPAALAKGVYKMGRHTGSFGSRATEVGRQGLVGGADTAMAELFEGAVRDADGDLSQAATNVGLPALIGVAAGAGGQFAFGELLPAMWKYGFNFAGKGSAEKIGSALLDTGPNKTGLTPENIRANLDLIRDGATLAEIPIGDAPMHSMMNRLADSFLEAVGIPDKAFLGGAKQIDAEEYVKTMGTIKDIGEEAHNRLRTTLTDTLGVPDSAYTRRIASNARLAPLRERYAKMSSTDVPGKGGNITRNYQPFVDRLNQRVVGKMGGGEVTDIGGFEKQYLAEAMRIIRPRKIHPNTRTVYTPKSGGDIEGEIDLSGAKVKMADLIRARKAMAEKLRPGQMIDGTSQTKERTAAALNVMKSLDDEIGSMVFGNNKTLNKQFSDMLKMDDAHASGVEFYTQRMAGDPDYGKSLKEYTDGLDEGALDGFRTGYKNAMLEAIDSNGLQNEMAGFLGDFNPESLAKITHEKFGNVENLRTVLGKTEADNFIKEINERSDFLNATERMREVAKRKGMSPDAVSGMIRDSDALLIAGGFSPTQNTLTANSTIGAIGRKLKSLGPRETARMQSLMNTSGDEGADAIEKWLKGFESRSELPAGQVGTGALPTMSDTKSEKTREKEKSKFDLFDFGSQDQN